MNTIDLLDMPGRKYKYDIKVDESYEKSYRFVETSRKTFAYAQDECGGIFDNFILYAIALMGVTDMESIRLFLKNYKKRYPDLLIGDMDSSNGLRSRIQALHKYGFIFNTQITYYFTGGKSGRPVENRQTLYTIDQEANELMNKTLSKRVPYNKGLERMPKCRMLGWAAVSFVGANISNHSNFRDYLDGAFRSKNLGKHTFPSEIKFFDGKNLHYVAMMDAYLIHDAKTQTAEDFAEWQAFKINAIRNYLGVRTTKGYAEFVLVVQDTDDLIAMGNLIIKTQILLDFLPAIYFTGEGLLRNVEYMEDAFLCMKMPTGNQEEVEFEFVTPAFLEKC